MGQSRFSQRRNRRIQNWFWIFSNQSISRPIFSKKKSVFHKGKIGEVEVRWIFSNRSISRPIFSRTKMEKGYFPKGRVEVGWIQRSIDFACNSKFSSGKGKWKKSLFSKSQISLDIVSLVGNPWPGRGLFLWGRVFLEGLDCCTIQRIGRGRVMAR